jgi:hypothetical protein
MIRNIHILSGSYSIPWNYGIKVDDIELLTERCSAVGIHLLGFEVHTESVHPCYCFVYEDFPEQRENDWVLNAIQEFKKVGIAEMIVPTFDIPRELMRKYLANDDLFL